MRMRQENLTGCMGICKRMFTLRPRFLSYIRHNHACDGSAASPPGTRRPPSARKAASARRFRALAGSARAPEAAPGVRRGLLEASELLGVVDVRSDLEGSRETEPQELGVHEPLVQVHVREQAVVHI